MNWLSKMLTGLGQKQQQVPWEVLVEAADSRNGFAREKAVIAIGKTGNDAGLRILLTRANDWVQEVRHAANAAIGLYLTEAHITAWAAALDQVAALKRARRADHSQLLQYITEYLSTPSNLKILRASNPVPGREVARLLFSLELRIPASEHERYELLRGTVIGDDIVTALLALNEGETVLSTLWPHLATDACQSPFASVRGHGLRHALRAIPPASPELIYAKCFDASASVRSVALRHIASNREKLEQELRSSYLHAPIVRHRVLALDVLCSLRVSDAEALCQSAWTDESSQVRGVAVSHSFSLATALGRDSLVLKTLRDASPHVRRIALKQVRRGAQSPDTKELLLLVQGHPAAFSSLARAATHLSPWSRLEFILGTVELSSQDPIAHNEVITELEKWCHDMHSCFATPMSVQVEVIRAQWAAVRDGLPVSLQRHVAESLRLFKILT